MTLLLLALLAAGLGAAAAGWFYRSRRIHAEHYVWKKRRLRKARLLSVSGSVVSTMSGVLLVLSTTGPLT